MADVKNLLDVNKDGKTDLKDLQAAAEKAGIKDVNDVTEYAVPALQWAVGHRVMDGTDDHKLMPKATTSRAEMAVILASFDRNIAN